MEVSGEKNFLYVANHPVLDLLNTAPVMGGERVELLENYGDLMAWAAGAGIIDAVTAERRRKRWDGTAEGARVIKEVLALREAVRGIVKEASSGNFRPRDLATVNRFFERTRVVSKLVQLPASKHLAVVDRDMDWESARSVLTAILRGAAALFAELSAGHVRKCENPACVLYFYDTSKNHSRRWCSMEVCGNRMKAAAHYRRVRGARG